MVDKSILWEDSTQRADRELLLAITKKIVSGSEKHQAKCVDKIMANIQAKAWQKQYTHRNFVFCVYYAQNINLIEINYALYAQAVDALYFLMSKNTSDTSLADKLRYVFKKVYGHKMTYGTAEAIRVLRNNVMHTGAIFGIDATIKAEDKKILQDFCNKFRPTTQIWTDQQILLNLAGTFDYLVQDLVVRILGLEWDDLSFNLKPPSRLNYFYEPSQQAQAA